jgi:hypothetical protein
MQSVQTLPYNLLAVNSPPKRFRDTNLKEPKYENIHDQNKNPDVKNY